MAPSPKKTNHPKPRDDGDEAGCSCAQVWGSVEWLTSFLAVTGLGVATVAEVEGILVAVADPAVDIVWTNVVLRVYLIVIFTSCVCAEAGLLRGSLAALTHWLTKGPLYLFFGLLELDRARTSPPPSLILLTMTVIASWGLVLTGTFVAIMSICPCVEPSRRPLVRDDYTSV